ncbi:hypothetical protein QF117_00190 [Vibrio sp. YMD68]|uniref:hypothetical protein n=1 Tax=Vibrio sp. YMD68 TaxID=3042300 RepID=UPI00249CEB8E|nr:hypothetical protein [Vibrio sp. YMD68]WGV98423.1 hypothetical protein QF117_00190 [Vibrio sp. YMD68]
MRLKAVILLLLVIAPFGVSACDLFESSTNYRVDSVVLSNSSSGINNGVCFSVDDTLNYAQKQWIALSDTFDDEPTVIGSYWDDWVMNSASDPFVTQNVSSNYFGLGVWMPSVLEDQLSSMSTEEWLMSHGLQLSVGFGDKKSGEPRMRFDYRWHEKYSGDVMMQFEVPF